MVFRLTEHDVFGLALIIAVTHTCMRSAWTPCALPAWRTCRCTNQRQAYRPAVPHRRTEVSFSGHWQCYGIFLQDMANVSVHRSTICPHEGDRTRRRSRLSQLRTVWLIHWSRRVRMSRMNHRVTPSIRFHWKSQRGVLRVWLTIDIVIFGAVYFGTASRLALNYACMNQSQRGVTLSDAGQSC